MGKKTWHRCYAPYPVDFSLKNLKTQQVIHRTNIRQFCRETFPTVKNASIAIHQVLSGKIPRYREFALPDSTIEYPKVELKNLRTGKILSAESRKALAKKIRLLSREQVSRLICKETKMINGFVLPETNYKPMTVIDTDTDTVYPIYDSLNAFCERAGIRANQLYASGKAKNWEIEDYGDSEICP